MTDTAQPAEPQPADEPPAPPEVPATSPASPDAMNEPTIASSSPPADVPPRLVEVHEVEAVPLTADEARAPSIDAPAVATGARAPASEPCDASTGPRAAPIGASDPSGAAPDPRIDPPPFVGSAAGGVPPPTDVPPPLAGAPSAPGSRFWAVLSHLCLFLTIPTFFLGAVATFLVWQLAGKRDAHTEDQAREALNFQINIGILTLVLGASCLGAPFLVVVWLLSCVFCVIAATHAGSGENYRYPLILRVVTH
jgi:uncharacterized Tic20 family protein